MSAPDERILDLVRQVDASVIPEQVRSLSGGFSSQAFKVERKDAPFVLLVERPGSVSETHYAHAHVILSLLQQKRVAHVPKPVWLSPDHHAIAVRFDEGTASDRFDFGTADALAIARAVIGCLLDASEAVRYDEYETSMRHIGAQPLPAESAVDAARRYGTEWFAIVESSCPDADIVEWLRPRIETAVAQAPSFARDVFKLQHGDPSNPNILIRPDGDFTVIDWDSARFSSTGPEFFVAFTTLLTDFMRPYRAELSAFAAERLRISPSAFAEAVVAYQRFNQIFDVNWAALMMAKVARGEASGDLEHFRRLAHERTQRCDETL